MASSPLLAGLTKPAHGTVKHQHFRVKTRDCSDITEAALRNLKKLPEDITEHPLRQVWMLKNA
ncbi:hypothetical protein [Brachybacterium squillarum]|uniref:hypothetical protein n=1 Tax=Brachybacterium squillarum TaxID=661979 RepID=UPI002223E0F7|nr:hypothetical protein [Brachybacterium squillarum]MCW1804360.1 hypothetical protein [Brachybacterium squillarum]